MTKQDVTFAPLDEITNTIKIDGEYAGAIRYCSINDSYRVRFISEKLSRRWFLDEQKGERGDYSTRDLAKAAAVQFVKEMTS